jgi:hypothetical protein
VFERFTDRARRVVVLAQEEARLLAHNYIGTEHVLLGLLREGTSVGARALTSFDVTLEAARNEVASRTGSGGQPPFGHIPFTPRAKQVLEYALREALALGHNYIGTEHILLGLIREGEGLGAQVLVALGVDLAGARQRVVELVAEGTESSESPPPPTPGLMSVPAPRPATQVCVVCGRDPWDADRYVIAAHAMLCGPCVDAAQRALGFSPERTVAMPPRGYGAPPPTPDDLLQIWELFAGGLDKAEYIEDGARLVQLTRISADRHPGMRATFVVDRVRRTGPQSADIHYFALVEPGGMRIEFEGRVVHADGRWKLARESYLEVMARGGVTPDDLEA